MTTLKITYNDISISFTYPDGPAQRIIEAQESLSAVFDQYRGFGKCRVRCNPYAFDTWMRKFCLVRDSAEQEFQLFTALMHDGKRGAEKLLNHFDRINSWCGDNCDPNLAATIQDVWHWYFSSISKLIHLQHGWKWLVWLGCCALHRIARLLFCEMSPVKKGPYWDVVGYPHLAEQECLIGWETHGTHLPN